MLLVVVVVAAFFTVTVVAYSAPSLQTVLSLALGKQ